MNIVKGFHSTANYVNYTPRGIVNYIETYLPTANHS